MTAPLTGFTTSLPSDVLLDSGVLYLGATVFGAFKGGLKFDPGITYRNVDFDGKRTMMKGLDIKTQTAPKISGTVITLTTAQVVQIDAGADVNATGGWVGATSSYAPQKAGSLLVAGDYVTSARCIWLRGDNSYVSVRFPSGLITKYDIASQDGAEVSINIEIEARLDTSWAGYTGVGDVPYRIEYLSALT
jgi:hypothetical protein